MESNEQIASEISQRIKNLTTIEQGSLKGEMQELKKAILENPQACMLLHDEDIGIMVSTLRKITGVAIATASEKKPRATKEKPKKLTAQELADALDDEDF